MLDMNSLVIDSPLGNSEHAVICFDYLWYVNSNLMTDKSLSNILKLTI